MEEITSVRMITDLEPGEAVTADEYDSIYAGIYHNSSYGEYTLYCDKASVRYVVIKSDDRTTVVGMKNARETDNIYTELLKWCGNR